MATLLSELNDAIGEIPENLFGIPYGPNARPPKSPTTSIQAFNHTLHTFGEELLPNSVQKYFANGDLVHPEEQEELLPDPYNKSNVMVEGNFVPERSTIMRQLKCPTMAKTKYGGYDALSFVTGTLIPESLGYMVGYAITGQGENTSKKATDRMGFTGVYGDRVLGYNYFVDPNKSHLPACSTTTSSTECQGKPNWMYLRNVPTSEPKGTATGAILEDIVDLNPAKLLGAFWGSGDLSSTCKKRTLPVGSSIDDPSKQNASRKAYLRKGAKCIASCKQDSGNYSNCIKSCSAGWWLENHCTSASEVYEYGFKEYFSEEKNGYSKLFVLVIMVLILCVMVLMASQRSIK